VHQTRPFVADQIGVLTKSSALDVIVSFHYQSSKAMTSTILAGGYSVDSTCTNDNGNATKLLIAQKSLQYNHLYLNTMQKDFSS
jgi:hypothetical protein